MQQTTINPDKQTIKSCLMGKTYSVDFYQREYVWNKITVETLLNDIFYAFDISYQQHKDSDLTPELLEQFNWYYLNVFITNTIDGKIYIVDGQQRLSTLTLIATKLYHITSNENLKPILKECVFSSGIWGKKFNIDNEKRKRVMDAVLSGIPFNEEYKNKTEETIIERYKDISKYIDNKNLIGKDLDVFICYFLERLVLVELGITQNDTPMIFEVINDRGEALKPFEILKGKFIGTLDKIDTEKYSDMWDSAMKLLSNMEDSFFIDYIKSRFVYKRNSKVESSINNSYHRYIFEANDIAEALCYRKSDPEHISNIKSFISSELGYYSRLYNKIKTNSIKNEHLLYVNKIHDLAGHFQIIMSACTVNDPEEDIKIVKIAMEYDRLYMLLRLNSLYDSNSFQEIAYGLNEKINDAPITEYRNIFNKVLIDIIEQRKGVLSSNSILEYNVFLKNDYLSMEKRSLRYFLARIEKYLCDNINQQMQNNVEYISTKTGSVGGYHIEHILSRNETNKSYFESEEEFESKRHQLGGLLLLKGLNNIASGNEEYENKLKTYSSGLVWGHSLNEDFYNSNISMNSFNNMLKQTFNSYIHSVEVFDKEALEQRNELLYNLVKIIWEVDLL